MSIMEDEDYYFESIERAEVKTQEWASWYHIDINWNIHYVRDMSDGYLRNVIRRFRELDTSVLRTELRKRYQQATLNSKK